jgi:hypothetical protein
VPAAFIAEAAEAEVGLLKGRDVFVAGRDFDGLGLPQAEGVYRPARPGATGTAMAIAHRLRRSRHFQFDRSAKAISSMTHDISSVPA